jgi:predicted ATPase/DNA-binding SARP family transcriptional activator
VYLPFCTGLNRNAKRVSATILPMEPTRATSVAPAHVTPGGAGAGRAPPSRLPAPVTPLVGRRKERDDLVSAVSASRLVTLTGPGGVGKTRLALAAAAQAQQRFSGRAWWVELTPVTSDDLVTHVIADALGARDAPGLDLADSIAGRIGEHPGLLVLDNCEHLTAACREVVTRLLAACPRLHILATSREPLGADGESRWPLLPLAVPQTEAPAGAQALLTGSEAVQFFLDRARAVLPGFEITDDNAGQVAQLCRRLDGLPLAIELAAPKLRVLAPGQVLAALDDVFKLLVGGRQGAPPRHQTLRAALDWSYDVLRPAEQAALRRLSAFAGPFGLAAAEHVATLGGSQPAEVLDLLAGLVDRSLLVTDYTAAEARYRMLGTVRQYGLERLAEAGERPAAEQALLSVYLDLAERTEAELTGPGQAAAGERLQAEVHNFRSVLQTARDNGDITAALRLAGVLSRFWYLRGHYREGRDWLDWALAAPSTAPAAVRAKALSGSGVLAHLQCEYPAAVRRLEGALRLYRELGDRRGIAGALQALGCVAREQSRYARAAELHAESLGEFEALGDRWGVASAHGYLGFVAWLRGDFAGATAECGQALTTFSELGDLEGIAGELLSLGVVALYRGEHAAAAEQLEQSRALSAEVGFREGVAWALHELGLLALRRGDQDAEPLLRQALEIHRDLGDRWRLATVLDDLAAAAIAARPSRPAQAARLLGAAQQVRDAIGTTVAPCERADHARTQTAARAALGDAAFADLARAGAAASLDSVVGGASRQPAEVSPQAGDRSPAATNHLAERKTPPARRPQAPAGSGAGPKAGALRLRLLGESTVHVAGRPLATADWGYAKPRELLYLFASSPPLSREQVGLALWPELTESQLRNALHSALRQLRRTLGDTGWIGFTDGRYALDGSRQIDSDLHQFEQALAEAGAARPPASALGHLQRAIAAYGGDFLADSTPGEWAVTRRGGLRRAYERALGAAGRLLVADGRAGEAADVYQRAIAHEPLDEAAHRALMECWATTGQTARALRHYAELTELLRAQLGSRPAAQTTALYERLRLPAG